MKARHCDECKHATVKWYEYKGPPAFDVLTCAKKHKPRHYMPRNAMDTDYGWKRVCADFETHNNLMGGLGDPDYMKCQLSIRHIDTRDTKPRAKK